jgi:dihydrofolate reductase
VSLDGYVADPNDRVDALHAWYLNGDVDTPTGTEGVSFRTSAASAEMLRDALANTGALITGRRNFDIAGGWGGSHPLGVPVFVVTHSTPERWQHDGAPFTFLDSVEEAISAAKRAAGEKRVVIASPSIAQRALALGLLDEIAISLVPVLLGDGIPFFARQVARPIALSDPRVVAGTGVTHLMYRVMNHDDRSAPADDTRARS